MYYIIGTGNNSISGTDDDDLDDDDLDDDDDEDVDVDGLDDQEAEGTVNEIIDIREPLIILKRKLEAKLETDLTEYDFYLQGINDFLINEPRNISIGYGANSLFS